MFIRRLLDLELNSVDPYYRGHAFRVPNDVTGVEEGVPLIFGIMAVSSAVFGGVHLVTWDFEFPSRGANPVEGERCRVHDTSLNLARGKSPSQLLGDHSHLQ